MSSFIDNSEIWIAVSDVSPTVVETNIGKIAQFFGVRVRMLTLKDILLKLAAPDGSRHVLVADAKMFRRLFDAVPAKSLFSRVAAAFVLAGTAVEDYKYLVSAISGRACLSFDSDRSVEPSCVVHENSEFCGPFSGLSIPLAKGDFGIPLIEVGDDNCSVVSVGCGVAVARFEFAGGSVYLCGVREIIDIDEPRWERNFNVRECFLSAIPLVMFIRYYFMSRVWRLPGARACVIIDDPVLRERYGCIDFAELLRVVQEHKFSANIAFIPWNWRRCKQKVVEVFKSNTPLLSISVHGCDHGAREFGVTDERYLDAKARLALSRMEKLYLAKNLVFDRVMVFPQGAFSKAALKALKANNFIAAANTEILNTECDPPALTTRSLWQPSISAYSFPILTRRYPSEGLENFASDLLLEKPCLVVIHHDYCASNFSFLTSFVDRLNSLGPTLHWTTLAETVRHTYWLRSGETESIQVHLFGNEATVRNDREAPQLFVIRKQEIDPELIEAVFVDGIEVVWGMRDEFLCLEVEVAPRSSVHLRVLYREFVKGSELLPSMLYSVRTFVRRHLSEARDTWVSRVQWLRANVFR